MGELLNHNLLQYDKAYVMHPISNFPQTAQPTGTSSSMLPGPSIAPDSQNKRHGDIRQPMLVLSPILPISNFLTPPQAAQEPAAASSAPLLTGEPSHRISLPLPSEEGENIEQATTRDWPLPAISPICYAGPPPAGTLFQVERTSVFLGVDRMPVPQEQAFDERGDHFVGRGSNGRICRLFFSENPYCIKMTHYRSSELDIYKELAEGRAMNPQHPGHGHVLIPEAFFMGSADPRWPSVRPCFHIMAMLMADLAKMMENAFLSRIQEREAAGQAHEDKDAASMAGVLTQYSQDGNLERLFFSVSIFKLTLQSILRGLSFLHDLGIAHNDLKPSNILYQHRCHAIHGHNIFACTCGPASQVLTQVKICDLDTATNEEQRTRGYFRARLARSGKPGTKGYRPPEWDCYKQHLNGNECKADIWSFGCTLMKLLTTHSVPLSPEDSRFLCDYHLRVTRNRDTSEEDIRRRERLTRSDILRSALPSWNSLHHLADVCLTADPAARPNARELLLPPGKSKKRDLRKALAFWSD